MQRHIGQRLDLGTHGGVVCHPATYGDDDGDDDRQGDQDVLWLHVMSPYRVPVLIQVM